MTSEDVTSQPASLDGPEMPAYLVAKVRAAIAAESAQRQFVTFR
jgi:hypothetical protein